MRLELSQVVILYLLLLVYDHLEADDPTTTITHRQDAASAIEGHRSEQVLPGYFSRIRLAELLHHCKIYRLDHLHLLRGGGDFLMVGHDCVFCPVTGGPACWRRLKPHTVVVVFLDRLSSFANRGRFATSLSAGGTVRAEKVLGHRLLGTACEDGIGEPGTLIIHNLLRYFDKIF